MRYESWVVHSQEPFGSEQLVELGFEDGTLPNRPGSRAGPWAGPMNGAELRGSDAAVRSIGSSLSERGGHRKDDGTKDMVSACSERISDIAGVGPFPVASGEILGAFMHKPRTSLGQNLLDCLTRSNNILVGPPLP